MASNQDLKPCPFCGSAPSIYTTTNGNLHSVECYECYAQGKVSNDIVEAIAAWNRRAALSPSSDKAVSEQEPLITVEASLRFQLECAEDKLRQCEEENRELRGKLASTHTDSKAPIDERARFEAMMRKDYPAFPLKTILISNHVIPNFEEELVYTSAGTQHMWNGFQVATRLASQVPDGLREIGRLISTQDNRCTDQPIFIVEQKRSYVTDPDYNDARFEWRETKSGEYIEADAGKAAELEKQWQSSHEQPEGWERYAMFDVWEFVTACFTEQGCKDYLAINGHNLKETRIYADGSYRNNEYRTVRNFLLSLAAAPTNHIAQDGHTSTQEK